MSRSESAATDTEDGCMTCGLRIGIGSCTQCVIRALRDAGVPGLDKWVRHVINALKGQPTMRPGLLVAWAKGYDVNLDESTTNPRGP